MLFQNNNGGGPPKGFSSEQTEAILNIWKSYQNKDSDQLLNDIFNNVAQEKAADRLTNEQILQFVKNVSPMLNSNQRQKLDEVVKKLTQI